MNEYSALRVLGTRIGPRDIQEYPSDICVALRRGHRKSALRSDSSHWGSYLVGRYGRGRPARSIRSGIVSIQSGGLPGRNEARPHIWFYYFVPARISPRDHSVRRRIQGVFVDECVQKRVQNRSFVLPRREKALNGQKPVPARRSGRLISVKTPASLEFGSAARRYLIVTPPRIPACERAWIHWFVRYIWISVSTYPEERSPTDLLCRGKRRRKREGHLLSL